jgi:hypothetical protein
MDYFIENHPIIINILCSIVASFVFLFSILIFMRPSIKISTDVAKERGEDGADLYLFKFVNHSYFKAFDVYAELYQLQKIPIKDGINIGFNTRLTKIDLPVDRITNFDAYPNALHTLFYKKNNEASFAYRIKCKTNLDEILNDEYKLIQLQITLRHGLTGLSEVFVQNYTDKNQLKQGSFAFGKNLNIN